MPQIFQGKSFTDHMNQELRKVTNHIENSKCAQIISKSDDDLSKDIDNILDPIYAQEIPFLDQTNIEKLFKAEGETLVWAITYKGNSAYFSMSPSQGRMFQSADLVGGKLQLSERKYPAENIAEAEARLQEKLKVVEESLQQLRDDLQNHFSKTKHKDGFLAYFKEKRDKCKAALPEGYKLV